MPAERPSRLQAIWNHGRALLVIGLIFTVFAAADHVFSRATTDTDKPSQATPPCAAGHSVSVPTCLPPAPTNNPHVQTNAHTSPAITDSPTTEQRSPTTPTPSQSTTAVPAQTPCMSATPTPSPSTSATPTPSQSTTAVPAQTPCMSATPTPSPSTPTTPTPSPSTPTTPTPSPSTSATLPKSPCTAAPANPSPSGAELATQQVLNQVKGAWSGQVTAFISWVSPAGVQPVTLTSCRKRYERITPVSSGPRTAAKQLPTPVPRPRSSIAR